MSDNAGDGPDDEAPISLLRDRWRAIFPDESFPCSPDDATRVLNECYQRVNALERALDRERATFGIVNEIVEFLLLSTGLIESERDNEEATHGSGSATAEGEGRAVERSPTPPQTRHDDDDENTEENDGEWNKDKESAPDESISCEPEHKSSSSSSSSGDVESKQTISNGVLEGSFRRKGCLRRNTGSTLRDRDVQRRSLSTGNLPCASKVASETGVRKEGGDVASAASSPLLAPSSSSQHLLRKAISAGEFDREKKGHRPRSMNVSAIDLRRKKRNDVTQPMVDQQNIFLVLPDNAVAASPSDDMFAGGGGGGGCSSGDISPVLERIQLTSPKKEGETKTESREMDRKESRFLDSLSGGAVAEETATAAAEKKKESSPPTSRANLVDLDEVSMVVFDDHDVELSSGKSSEAYIDDEDDDDEDDVVLLVSEPVVTVRERKERSQSPRSRVRDGVHGESDWAVKFEGDVEPNTGLADFYRASLTELRSSEDEPEDSAFLPRRKSATPSGDQLQRHSVSSHLSESPDSEGVMRKLIMSSILDSEKSYVDSLRLICQHYQKPLSAVATTSQPLLSTKDCDIIFYKHEELLRTHSRLYDALEPRVINWSANQSVADCFGILIDILPVYKQYIANYPRALEILLKRKAENQHFANFVDSAAQMKSARMRIPLDELLRRPAEKLQSYSQVLKDLLKHTPDDHMDHDQLAETSEAVLDMMRSLSQGPADTERGKPLKGEVVVELTDSGRKFRHLCLFEDVLMCVKQKGAGRQRKYECKWYLPLAELAFHPPPESEVPGPVPVVSESELEHLQAKVGKLKLAMRQEQAAAEGKIGRTSSVKLASSKLDKLKKKLREHESTLRLVQPCLPLRLFDVGGKVYTLLFAQESQRQVWLEAISSARDTARPVEVTPYELGTLVQRSRRLLRRSDSIRSVLMEADGEDEFLNGVLQIQVHSAKGILSSRQGRPDLFCTVEVDSYGRFDRKAKTRVVKDSLAPSWDQDFEVDVHGAQTLKIICWDKKSLFNDEICGKGKIELSTLGLADNKKHSTEINLMPKGCVRVSLCYMSGSQSLRRPPSVSTAGLFAVPIDVVCRREMTQIPAVVTMCCEEIEERGVNEVGIYRVSGVTSDVKNLKEAFERGIADAKKLLSDIDIHAVSGLLKMYFRELPEPVLTDELYPRFVEGMALADPEAKQRCMASLIHTLPPINLKTSLYLFRHLKRIAANEKVNKMSLNNLSTVFGPNLLRPAGSNGQTAALEAMSYVGILLNLIRLPNEMLQVDENHVSGDDAFPTTPEEV